MDATRDSILSGLNALGLVALGAFAPTPEDGVPSLTDGAAGRTLLLVGNAGPAMWRAFDAAGGPAAQSLDSWCRFGLAPLAARAGGVALFPWDRPYQPFQRWLRRAGRTFASPIGIDIHPEYGLWWGLRGALVIPGPFVLPPPASDVAPCEQCADRPCLATCPVGAFREHGYDIDACVAHLSRPQGEDCMTLACRARRACPVGTGYRHEAAQAAFHMAAFRAACRAEE